MLQRIVVGTATPMPALPSKLRKSEASRHHVQPVPYPPGVLQCVETFDRAERRLCHDIVGKIWVTEQSHQITADSRAMGLDQLA